ncbi:thiamine phosphate synthase [Consotaella aegiceratis]|uniref:thiamine phosphate synthase n=1 Tax=Consotaella aegiceratis TaxID=3097961 RepID=UPI002F41D95E
MPSVDYRLNAIVDTDALGADSLAQLARQAAEGGATLIQYRDKHGSTREMIERARAILAALDGTGVPMVVNDRADVAFAAGAAGVHLGRDDMDAETARRLLGPGAIIGVTVKSEDDADKAIAAPADYTCVGGVFETLSKHNPDPPVGIDGLERLVARIRSIRPDLPVGAIAGIDLGRVPAVIAAGADGVAAISAIFKADDARAATTAFREAIDAALTRKRS